MTRVFFGFDGEAITTSNWEALYDHAAEVMQRPDWTATMLAQQVGSRFSTNEFDDPLEGFDTSVYVPCLRIDDLVFHLTNRRCDRGSTRRPAPW